MIEDCLEVVNCQQVQPAMSMVKGAALMTSEPIGAHVVQTKNRSISAAISNFSYTGHILQDNHKCTFSVTYLLVPFALVTSLCFIKTSLTETLTDVTLIFLNMCISSNRL